MGADGGQENGTSPALRLPYAWHDGDYLSLLTKALQEVARQEPSLVEGLLASLPAMGQLSSFLRLKAIAAAGQPLAHLLPSLLIDENLMSLGASSDEWRPFAEAASAAIPFLSPSDRNSLEAAVLAQRPELDWVSNDVGRRDRLMSSGWIQDWRKYALRQLALSGTKERAILRTIGPENLSPRAQARLAELDRKFPNVPLPEENTVRGGWVRSPISPEAAEKMSDAQWLKAMKRYATDDNHIYLREEVIGGARQLSSTLQARAKVEPERFVALLERMPGELNEAYAEAIISGLREAGTTPELAARAIRVVLGKGGEEFHRTVCWCVQQYPEAAADREILSFVIDVASHSSASDTAVTSSSPERVKREDMRELLSLDNDWEMSGINANRGAAYEALARVLWELPETYETIASLIEMQVDIEPLNSVRLCMLHVVNSIAKYNAGRAIATFKKFASLEPQLLLGRYGHHFLNWAIYAHPEEFTPLIDDVSRMQPISLRALGRLLESGLAISDEAREAAFRDKFPLDALARQAAAYRASGNLTNDSVGDRAARWIGPLFDDEIAVVRDEASNSHWEAILSGGRMELVRTYIHSRSFADHPDRVLRALQEHLDEASELTLEAVRRVLALHDENSDIEQRRRIYMATHGIGRSLVRLYRAFENDLEKEREMLDLFDQFLARDVHDMRSEIEAYERA